MTYDSYEEAKIANPHEEILKARDDWDGCKCYIGKFVANKSDEDGGIPCIGKGAWKICNPVDYAVSVMEKKVNVEYVKEESFKEALKCAIDGEVFYSKDGKGEFRFDASRMSFVNHDGADMKIANLTYHEFYRRIETPIEWWEDASEFVNQTDDVNCSSIMEGELHVNATLTRKQWCDFARTLLEQGE